MIIEVGWKEFSTFSLCIQYILQPYIYIYIPLRKQKKIALTLQQTAIVLNQKDKTKQTSQRTRENQKKEIMQANRWLAVPIPTVNSHKILQIETQSCINIKTTRLKRGQLALYRAYRISKSSCSENVKKNVRQTRFGQQRPLPEEEKKIILFQLPPSHTARNCDRRKKNLS